MKQSPNDSKAYKTLTLENGLRVLLIRNQKSKKAAAALTVNVGHFSDPENRQGLAHFLEHMLFLGTEKYPDGSEYQKFISQHGGSNNAWTATEHTCFFFDVYHDHFDKALDRFSQFFISPLLSQEFIEKERENIDAEFKMKLKDDIRRLYDVHKETINPAHPFSKFSVGNLDTLADRNDASITEDVKRLFNDFYYAPFMTLAIESPSELESLEALAKQYFSPIRTTTKALPKISVPLYQPQHQQKLINVKPVKNDRQLIISFAMPSIDEFYREKPESLLAYLLGHEGKGSILSLLKQNGWAIGLTAGSGVNGSNFKDFNISIPLTVEGENHIDEIISIVFSYISLMKNNEIAPHYYEDKQSISELAFTYQEKLSPLDSVSQLVVNMQHYPAEDYMFGDYVMAGLIEKDYQYLLNMLSAENMRIVHISHQSSFDKTSKWYKVPYKVTIITPEKIAGWQSPAINDSLFLPTENKYIVAKPSVLENETEAGNLLPALIKQQNGLNLWFKQDQTFKVPKGYIYIGLDSAVTIASTQNIAMTRLFVDIYSDAIVEEHYDAELAGIHYHLYSHQGGLSLQLSGLSEKQDDLLVTLLESLKNVDVSESRFNLLKEQLITHWRNADKSKSISQLFSVLSSALQPSNPSANDMLTALSHVNFEQFVTFCKSIFKQVSLDILVHGNWHKKTAFRICDIVLNALEEGVAEEYKVKVPLVDMTDKGQINLPLVIPEHDHACVIYYPLSDKAEKTIAKTIITTHLLSPLFFQQMRTEKQFGYLVGVGYVPIHNYPGVAFYIQSPHTDSFTLSQAIDEFIENYQEMLSSMPLQEWSHLQQGLAGQLQEKDTSLRIRSQRFWAALCNGDNSFTHKQKVIDAILSLELSDILDFIKNTIYPKNGCDRINLLTFSDDEQKNKIGNKMPLISTPSEITNLFERKR